MTTAEKQIDSGLPEAFWLAAQLAEAHGRIPCGDWSVGLGEGWTLRINGTAAKTDYLPPYHAAVLKNEMPVIVVSPEGGTVVGAAENEDRAIEALQRALTEAKSQIKRVKIRGGYHQGRCQITPEDICSARREGACWMVLVDPENGRYERFGAKDVDVVPSEARS